MADHVDNEECPKSLIPILKNGINLKTTPLPSIFTQRYPTVPLTKLDMRDYPSTSTGIYHHSAFPDAEVKPKKNFPDKVKSKKKAYRPLEKPFQIFEHESEKNKKPHHSKRAAGPLEKPYRIYRGKNETTYHFKRIKDEEIEPKEKSIVTAVDKIEKMPKKKRPLFSLASPKTGDMLRERESMSPMRFESNYLERPTKKSTSRFEPPTTRLLDDMIKIISPERKNSAFARYKSSNRGKHSINMSNRSGRCCTTKKTNMAAINFGSVPLKPKPSTSLDTNNTKASSANTLAVNKDIVPRTLLPCSLKSQKQTASTAWSDTIAFRRSTSEDVYNKQNTNETLHINADKHKRTLLPCSLKFQKRTESTTWADAIPFLGSTSQDVNTVQSAVNTLAVNKDKVKRTQLPCSLKCQKWTGSATWADTGSASQDVNSKEIIDGTLDINKNEGKRISPSSSRSPRLFESNTWANIFSFGGSTSKDVNTKETTEEALHINKNDIARKSPSSLKSPKLTESNMSWANAIPFRPGGLFKSASPGININTKPTTDEALQINKYEHKTGSPSNVKSSKLTESTRWAFALIHFILIFVKLISHPLRIPFRRYTSPVASSDAIIEETLRMIRDDHKRESPNNCAKKENLNESPTSTKTEYFIKKEVLIQNFFVVLDKHNEDIKNGVPPNPSHQFHEYSIEILAQLSPIRVVTEEEAFIPYQVQVTDIEPCSTCACSFIGRNLRRRFIIEALLEINFESKTRLPERKLFDLARALSTL